MIVCSCNRLSAADVRGCLLGHPAPRSVADVYQRLGCTPKCGTCARTIYGIMAASQAGADMRRGQASVARDSSAAAPVPGAAPLSSSGLTR